MKIMGSNDHGRIFDLLDFHDLLFISWWYFLNQMISFENFCTYAYLKFMSVIFLKPIVWLVLLVTVWQR